MRKHNDLDGVVGHAFGHTFVGCYHAATEILALPLDSERAAAVPDPVRELRWRVLAQPSDEKFQDLLVLHRVSVGGVGNVDVIRDIDLCRRNWLHVVFYRLTEGKGLVLL